jgi:uncharacterized protein involved in response to NO
VETIPIPQPGLTWVKAERPDRAHTVAMNTMAYSLPFSPRLLAAAPHRLLFFVGAANVLLAMGWWALWLAAARWQVLPMPQPPIPAGWGHAFVMTYQVLTPFIFGFLLTVFPRWMGLPALTRWHYVPVGLGLFGGQLLTLAGLWGHPHLLHVGVVFTLAGWVAGMCFLFGVLWRENGRTWHALSAFAALGLGLVGLMLFAGWLHGAEARWVFASFKLGMLGLLLPIYFTVCHRMLPFFAGCVLPGYRSFRPMWMLGAFWALALLHLALELAHGYAWLWLADLPLAALAATLLWRWWPRAPMPGLLRVLFIGFAWLPLAMLLYSAQSLWFLASGEFALGRAPVHALAVGFFGSLLVAMVTRVTQGHSGRPLEMPATAWFAFAAVQVLALMRIVGEVLPDYGAWQALAAAGWLLAFAPWVLRSLGIYLSPRTDGKAG